MKKENFFIIFSIINFTGTSLGSFIEEMALKEGNDTRPLSSSTRMTLGRLPTQEKMI